ncbi:MAG: NAD(P)/FAD-dependent oxidoreductase, partial [Streptosporangiaceae bacterium]
MRLIVVGSGIVGAACAYTAAGLGAQVTLVDAGRAGQATAAGAGIICPWTAAVDDPSWYDFACAAARQYPSLIAELADLGEADVSYRRVGALLITENEDQLDQARKRLTDRRATAPEISGVEPLTSAQARDMFPPLKPGLTALHIAGAARVDGRRLAAALIRAAAKHGTTTKHASTTKQGTTTKHGITTRNGIAHLAIRGSRVTGVTIDGELIEADAVVAAAGAWTAELLAPAGQTIRVAPQRGQIAHFGLGTADTSRWPVILPTATGHYLLAFDDSRIVAGATREPGAGFDYRVTPAGLAEVLGEAL